MFVCFLSNICISLYLLLRAQGQQLGAKKDQLTLLVHRSLFWPLSRDRYLHGLGMSHIMTTSPPKKKKKKNPSGYLGGWVTPWLAEEMPDEQHQRVDIPAHARTAHKGLLQKSLEEDLCLIIPPFPLMTQWVMELN